MGTTKKQAPALRWRTETVEVDGREIDIRHAYLTEDLEDPSCKAQEGGAEIAKVGGRTYYIAYPTAGQNFGVFGRIRAGTMDGEVMHETAVVGYPLYGSARRRALQWIARADLLTSTRITVDPAVLAGKPIIRGTRISVEFVVDLLARGWTTAQILEEYDHLTNDDVQACRLHSPEDL